MKFSSEKPREKFINLVMTRGKNRISTPTQVWILKNKKTKKQRREIYIHKRPSTKNPSWCYLCTLKIIHLDQCNEKQQQQSFTKRTREKKTILARSLWILNSNLFCRIGTNLFGTKIKKKTVNECASVNSNWIIE